MHPFPQFAANPLRTRDDLQRLVGDLTSPLTPHFSLGRAQVRLGANQAHYGDPAGWLEGFARPLWGLAPLAAGGGDFSDWSLWQEGLASGVDPAHEEYWGLAGDYDQRSVEQAAFGFAIALAPERFWEPLSAKTRERLAAWLIRINDVELVRSNWLFFRVLVNLGLKHRGQPFSQAAIEADFDRIEGFHLGDGWYEDGKGGAPWRDGRTGDYYVPMAFQLYSLIYAKLAGADDTERCARLRERATVFAQDFQHFFAADGSALPFGRSLAYRFAQGSFWGGLAFADVEALPWPVIKGLYLRHLRWWMKQPVFSETGLLSIGYTYPNLIMAESYNSPGSPYWAYKAFLPLALPEEHPFWQAEEAPLPARRAVHSVAGAKLILTTDPRSREITAINPGQPTLEWPRNAPHKYSKCAYSTHFGFSVPVSVATPAEGGLDNGLSLSDDGRFFRHREQCFDGEVNDGVAFSRWNPWPDVEVRTWLLAEPTGHLRIHHIRSDRKLWSMEAGFAVNWDRRAELKISENGDTGPEVRTPAGASTLRDLLGDREGGIVDLGANSHLLASLSSMPVLRAEHAAGEFWLVCRASGSADSADNFSVAKTFEAEADPDGCRILLEGKLWWTSTGQPCGESSPERLKALQQLV
jgi:hypothetical protein